MSEDIKSVDIDDLTYQLLSELVCVDTHDTDLRCHPAAYAAVVRFAEALSAAKVAQERARLVNAEAASERRWTDWLVEHGLLHYHQSCRRPDGSHGPAWVLRTPHMSNGDSCEAWSADSAADALRSFLRPNDKPPPTDNRLLLMRAFEAVHQRSASMPPDINAVLHANLSELYIEDEQPPEKGKEPT